MSTYAMMSSSCISGPSGMDNSSPVSGIFPYTKSLISYLIDQTSGCNLESGSRYLLFKSFPDIEVR